MLIEYELTPINKELGDLFTIEEFIEHCMSGGFIDYDGHGYLSTKTLESNIQIKPSDFVQRDIINEKNFEIPFVIQRKELKYINWYNR